MSCPHPRLLTMPHSCTCPPSLGPGLGQQAGAIPLGFGDGWGPSPSFLPPQGQHEPGVGTKGSPHCQAETLLDLPRHHLLVGTPKMGTTPLYG